MKGCHLFDRKNAAKMHEPPVDSAVAFFKRLPDTRVRVGSAAKALVEQEGARTSRRAPSGHKKMGRPKRTPEQEEAYRERRRVRIREKRRQMCENGLTVCAMEKRRYRADPTVRAREAALARERRRACVQTSQARKIARLHTRNCKP